MYESFFGLRERPFHVTADVAFLFPSRDHQEAMAHLLYGIQQRLGFLMIVGEVGTGKTTLIKALLDRLQPPIKTALVLNPTLSGPHLLKSILHDFGFESNATQKGILLMALEKFLVELSRLSGNAVLIVDEAQALSFSSLETIRLLSNIETDKSKLIQIVLVGQPELANRLVTDRKLRALRERIAVRYSVQPLSETEVSAYIHHRILIAGGKESPRFTEEAVAMIADASKGIPRRINLICDRALLAGYVKDCRDIDHHLVKEALATATGSALEAVALV